MGQGGTCPSPNIYEGGTSMVMSPNILEVILSSNSNNCCLLYFNANIMCSFTIKASASGGRDPLPGLRPWISLGDFRPPYPQSSFMSPNNPVRSTPLVLDPLPRTKFPGYTPDCRMIPPTVDPSELGGGYNLMAGHITCVHCDAWRRQCCCDVASERAICRPGWSGRPAGGGCAAWCAIRISPPLSLESL